jgi:hypothetical protein
MVTVSFVSFIKNLTSFMVLAAVPDTKPGCRARGCSQSSVAVVVV